MLRHIILLLCILNTICLHGQTGTIKVQKPESDIINLVGQWIRLYDKTPDGKTIKLKKDEIDTLNYYPNHKFLKQEAGSKEFSTWELKEKLITRRNVKFTMTFEGKVITDNFEFTRDSIGIVTKDTLTLLELSETFPKPTLYKTNYYYKNNKH
jgi:hypothetical protein